MHGLNRRPSEPFSGADTRPFRILSENIAGHVSGSPPPPLSAKERTGILPIDILKIDRSFINEIPDNQDDMEITSAVVAMAHNLKLKVVAEGIETPEQLAFLRRHRCDVGQGYLFDRPIPGRELAERLKRYPRGPVA